MSFWIAQRDSAFTLGVMRLIPLLVVLANCGFAGEPLIPALFKTYYTSNRLEQKIGDCKNWPAQTVHAFHKWLESGAWKNGDSTIPTIRSVGSFVFRQTETNRAWVITLLADSSHLIVEEAKVDSRGVPKADPASLRCLEHKKFAEILEAEIRRSYPEGAQRIDDEREFMNNAPALKKKN